MLNITLLLAEDRPVVRRGLRFALDQVCDVTVVGETSLVRATVEMDLQLRPRVALVDVELADGSGADACRQIIASGTGTAVLMLTALDWDMYLAETWGAGAVGLATMQAELDDLVQAVRRAAAGMRLYTSDQMRRIQDWQEAVEARFRALTPREWEVLQLIAAGRSNRQIAEELVLTQSTVEKHVSSLLRKVGVCSRQSLVAFLVEHHLEGSDRSKPWLQAGGPFLM